MNITNNIRRESFDKLYDDKTKRPSWAGDCKVTVFYTTISNATSDRRCLNLITRKSDSVPVVEEVSAVIVPVQTDGRITEDVHGHNLRHFKLDRGHLLAYSLGAPRTSDIMFAQPRGMNQYLEDTVNFQEKNQISNLGWRAFEIFILFLAIKGVKNEKVDFKMTDEALITGSFGKFHIKFKKYDCDLIAPTVNQYRSGSYNPEANCLVKYIAKVDWGRRVRLIPKTIAVDIEYNKNIYKWDFDVEDSINTLNNNLPSDEESYDDMDVYTSDVETSDESSDDNMDVDTPDVMQATNKDIYSSLFIDDDEDDSDDYEPSHKVKDEIEQWFKNNCNKNIITRKSTIPPTFRMTLRSKTPRTVNLKNHRKR